MSIITVGIDLAKNVFAVHGVDETGKAVLVKPKVPRDQLATLIAQLPPCLIGMEACTGAHRIIIMGGQTMFYTAHSCNPRLWIRHPKQIPYVLQGIDWATNGCDL